MLQQRLRFQNYPSSPPSSILLSGLMIDSFGEGGKDLHLANLVLNQIAPFQNKLRMRLLENLSYSV